MDVTHIFAEQQAINDNNKCFHCNAANPRWASHTNGIYVCLNCAGLHRALGVHISHIKSLTLDTWKPAEVQTMQHAGNAVFRRYLMDHGVMDMSPNMLSSDVARGWREYLASKKD
ncbi:ADP-ribosylation factor GTPase-activating protein 1 [Pelomyxa schiedti]|nr:ADP-ribosylation factor GTPase-activating protein 1 [Pelomyxa schiedti]